MQAVEKIVTHLNCRLLYIFLTISLFFKNHIQLIFKYLESPSYFLSSSVISLFKIHLWNSLFLKMRKLTFCTLFGKVTSRFRRAASYLLVRVILFPRSSLHHIFSPCSGINLLFLSCTS